MAHVVGGAVLAGLTFLGLTALGVEVFADPSLYLDTGVWWWWAPFCAMGFLVALLTVRRGDRRVFWNVAVALFLAHLLVVVWLPGRMG